MKIPRLLLFACAALLLSACTMQVNTAINPDGSGKIITEIGFTAQDKEMFAGFGQEMTDICASMQEDSDLPSTASIRQEERGDETWCIIDYAFNDLQELRQYLEEGDGITVNRLEFVGDTFYYDLLIDMSSEDSGFGSAFPITLNWQVTLPGKVGDNNADKVEGKTLTWNLPINQSVSVQAQSSVSGGLEFPSGNNMIWVIASLLGCLCCFAFLVIVAVVVFVLLRKRKSSLASQPATTPAAAPNQAQNTFTQPPTIVATPPDEAEKLE